MKRINTRKSTQFLLLFFYRMLFSLSASEVPDLDVNTVAYFAFSSALSKLESIALTHTFQSRAIVFSSPAMILILSMSTLVLLITYVFEFIFDVLQPPIILRDIQHVHLKVRRTFIVAYTLMTPSSSNQSLSFLLLLISPSDSSSNPFSLKLLLRLSSEIQLEHIFLTISFLLIF